MLSVVLLLAVAPGGVARYPLALQVEATGAARAALYVHEGPGYLGLSAPPSESSVSFVGKQAVEAYGSFAGRFFDPAAKAGLRLSVVAVVPSVELDNDGWHAVVEHRLALFDSNLALASWTVQGRGHVNGLGEGALPAAFGEAAVMAARRFEARFEEPIKAFLASLGVAPGAVALRPAVAEAPSPPPEKPPAVDLQPAPSAIYLEAGGHLAPLSYQSTSFTSVNANNGMLVEDHLSAGLDLRLGVAGGWYFAQAAFSTGSGRAGDIAHAISAIGADIGLLLRFNASLKLMGGFGLSSSRLTVSTYAFGPRPVSQSHEQLEPDLLVALCMAQSFGSRVGMRLTLEARYRLLATDTSMINETYHDHLDGGASVALLLGIDLPFSPRAP